MSQHFSDLEGIETDIDDTIVHAETEVKHDHRLHAVLEQCEKINLTLNKEKYVFKVKEVNFIGHKLTQEGIKPDDEKVHAINDMPAPTDKKGVERLLEKVNTPNANMADNSVVAQDELHESEVSQSSMFCFENAFPENSCFVVDLFSFISLWLRVAVFLNATRRDRNIPPFTS